MKVHEPKLLLPLINEKRLLLVMGIIHLPSKENEVLRQDLSDFPLDKRFVGMKSKGEKSVLHEEEIDRMRRFLGKCADDNHLSEFIIPP